MSGKQILLDALRGKITARPAWLPFVGVHGGKMIGAGADAYLRSSELIVKGLKKAYAMYEPDGLPIVFDLQLEAEVLGCVLHWADRTPPSVTSHPLENGELDGLAPFDIGAGRFPIVFEALETMKRELGEQVALYGLLTGPFTLAMHLRGNEIFLDMFDQPEKTEKLLAFCTGVAKEVASAYLARGADVIAVVDPMTSQISPEHFEEFVTPHVNELFGHIRAHGGLSSLFVCGDASRNLEVMSATLCDNISVDENICLETLRDLAKRHKKSFGGNLRLTLSLLMGDEDDCKLDAIRCMDIGQNHGFVLAPGCDLPYDTPEANLQAVSEMVHNEYQRQVARTTITARAATTFDDIVLPDFVDEPHVIVDVITLDSAACAPCQYMVNAVRQAAKGIDHPLVIREHKITAREGVGYMLKLGVSAIPTICIDGEIAFSSIIPDTRTLTAALNEKIRGKRES